MNVFAEAVVLFLESDRAARTIHAALADPVPASAEAE